LRFVITITPEKAIYIANLNQSQQVGEAAVSTNLNQLATIFNNEINIEQFQE